MTASKPAPLKIEGSIVDMTGDGVWPHMSQEIRDNLIAHFFDVDWKVHDVSLFSRDKTNDAALDAALADLKQHKAAIKGPTITPTTKQTADLKLSKQWGSPNGKIRSAINGAAILRNTIEVKGLEKKAPGMVDVTIARQAVGGIYGAPNVAIPGKGTVKLVYTDESGKTSDLTPDKKVENGVAMLTTETDRSIYDYAHAVLQQGLAMNKSVQFAAKSTINPVYDGRFITIFNEVYDKHYADQFKKAGLQLMTKDPAGDDLLIDSLVSKIPQGKLNGWIVALKNYDGDVVSDQVAGEHCSLGLMDSTLVSADGTLLADPPHGTAPDLEKAWHEKKVLLANPTAHIFAYAEAIRHKASLSNDQAAVDRALALKQAVVATIEAGLATSRVTGDLAKDKSKAISGQQFIADVRETLLKTLAADTKSKKSA